MTEEKLSSKTTLGSDPTISVRRQLLESLMDEEYRRVFVQERVRSSVALQIRAVRDQRKMTQKELGDAMAMAQTWVSKLENPEYGKMTVSTLLRLANEFDTDLEIKFRPFSVTLSVLPRQGPDYFQVPGFTEELTSGLLFLEKAPEEVEQPAERTNAATTRASAPISTPLHAAYLNPVGFVTGIGEIRKEVKLCA